MTPKKIRALERVLTVNADIAELCEKRGITKRDVEELCRLATLAARGGINTKNPWERLAKAFLIRLDTIAETIENVDARCMAVDGPVTDTRQEMTAKEMRLIYLDSKVDRNRIELLKGRKK